MTAMSRTRETIVVALLGGLWGPLPHRLPSEEPGKLDPIAPVSITHITGLRGPLQFSYSDPANVLKLYVCVDGELLVPRPGVRWFTAPKPGAKQTEVSLGDGESHVFRIHLADYFDLPPGRSGEDPQIHVAVSLSIPGKHQVPQLSRCSRSVLVPARKE